NGILGKRCSINTSMKDTFRVEIHYGSCEPKTSNSGQVQFVWKANPVARINQGILGSIGFLYRTREEADGGTAKSATAFVVNVPSEGATTAGIVNNLPMGLCHAYVATASHVVHEGYTVLRLAQASGNVDILELPKKIGNTHEISGEDAWIWHDEGNDIAVY